MQHIIILGDSWGEPNWRGPYRPGFTEQGHIEHRLRSQGYAVTNYSRSGGSNLNSWQRLDHDPPAQADWIIWFHTEVIRDLATTRRGTLAQLLDETADGSYAHIAAIRRRHSSTVNAKLLVIEGQSRRHLPHFDLYFKDYELIKDLRSTLLDRDLPYTPLLAQISNGGEILSQFTDPDHVKSQWIDSTSMVMDLMAASPMFPDRCHPGDLAHSQLTRRVVDIIKRNTA